jgi:hypothetical protein
VIVSEAEEPWSGDAQSGMSRVAAMYSFLRLVARGSRLGRCEALDYIVIRFESAMSSRCMFLCSNRE